jgi:hypothetical protein
VLKNPVRVEALYDRDEAERATLTNLLQRQGYQDLEAVLVAGRQQGEAKGRLAERAAAVLAVLDARGLRLAKAARERVERSTDLVQLDGWLRRAAVAKKAGDIFE